MHRRKVKLMTMMMVAPLLFSVPVVVAQENPPSELPRDQQKMMDLLNAGMDLERAGDIQGAEKIYRRWIGESAKLYGDDSPLTGLGYRLLAGSMESQGRWADAEALRRRLYDQNRGYFGENHDETITAAGFLAVNYVRQGRSADALLMRQAILQARIATLGEKDPKSIIALSNVASSLTDIGQFEAAEELYRKVLATSLEVHGKGHMETASAYGNLAVVLRARGQYAAAEPLLNEALLIDQRLSRGPNKVVALRLYNRAVNYGDMGRQNEAQDNAVQALEMWSASSGPDSVDAALGHLAVGYSLSRAGKYDDADLSYRQALDIRTKQLGANHPLTGEVLNNLAMNMDAQGRPPAVIEPYLRQALDNVRATTGDSSERAAILYGNIAQNLNAQGRYDEAAALYRRAMELREKLTGAAHPAYASLLINYGHSLQTAGDLTQAHALMRRAVTIYEAALGLDHADTAWAHSSLASLLSVMGQHQEAAIYARKSLDVRRHVLGERHLLTATSYHNVAAALTRSGQGDEAAEPYYRHALAILEFAVGDKHIDTARAYESLGSNLNRQGRAKEAEQAAGRAMDIYRAINAQIMAGGALSLSALDRRQADPDRGIYTSYMNAAFSLMSQTPDAIGQSALQDRAFMAAQDAIATASGRAILQTAARNAAKNPKLAEAVRQEQEYAARANLLDKNLLRALSENRPVEAATLRGDLDSVRAQLTDLAAQIDRQYPSYRQLVSPRAVGLAESQKSLRTGEALLMMTEAANTVHVFVVTPDAVVWSRPSVEMAAILKQISDLRCDVDYETCTTARKAELDAMPMSEEELNGRRRFDLAASHNLYKILIAPVEPMLAKSQRIYVNASGKLGDLPLALLSASPSPEGADIADTDVLARAKWLADRYAFTSLPSVAALTLPRDLRTISTSQSFRGYGAPVLAGSSSASRAAVSVGVGAFAGLSRSGSPLADPSALRQLAPLPGTKIELRALANMFPATGNSLAMEKQATEAALRQDKSVEQAHILVIATHGLLPEPSLGLGEPGLVLTPPATPSDLDDGLLTATEAAQLNLSADWVILSACNTASAENSGGNDSLSALARGFLFAGANALLASHWRVSDETTAALTVETLSARQGSEDISRAKALSVGMANVRTGIRADGSKVSGWKAEWAHPSAWAAFTNIANFD